MARWRWRMSCARVGTALALRHSVHARARVHARRAWYMYGVAVTYTLVDQRDRLFARRDIFL